MLMRSEAQPAPGAVPVEDAIASPPELTDEDVAAYINRLPAMAPATPPVEPETSAAEEPAAPATDPEHERIVREHGQMKAYLTQLAQSQRNQAAANGEKPPTREELISNISQKVNDAGLDPDITRALINDMMVPLIDGMVMPVIAQTQQQAQQTAQQQQQQTEERLASDFTTTIDTLMTDAGVNDTTLRDMVRNHVAAKGHQVHGEAFNLSHVPALLNEVVQDLRKSEALKAVDTITKKEEAIDSSPPVAHAQAPATAVESIEKRLADPNDQDMDLTGPGMARLVAGIAGAGSRAKEAILGG